LLGSVDHLPSRARIDRTLPYCVISQSCAPLADQQLSYSLSHPLSKCSDQFLADISRKQSCWFIYRSFGTAIFALCCSAKAVKYQPPVFGPYLNNLLSQIFDKKLSIFLISLRKLRSAGLSLKYSWRVSRLGVSHDAGAAACL